VGHIGFSPYLPSYFIYKSLVGSILWPSPPAFGLPLPLGYVEAIVAPFGSRACLFFIWIYLMLLEYIVLFFKELKLLIINKIIESIILLVTISFDHFINLVIFFYSGHLFAIKPLEFSFSK